MPCAVSGRPFLLLLGVVQVDVPKQACVCRSGMSEEPSTKMLNGDWCDDPSPAPCGMGGGGGGCGEGSDYPT